MKVILIITSLWQGNPDDPRNTVSFLMASMAECHRKAQEWVRHHGGSIITTCKISDELPTYNLKNRVSDARSSTSHAIR